MFFVIWALTPDCKGCKAVTLSDASPKLMLDLSPGGAGFGTRVRPLHLLGRCRSLNGRFGPTGLPAMESEGQLVALATNHN